MAERSIQLLAELGSGSFGAVYHALLDQADGTKRAVALKVLHPTWSLDSDAAMRLRDEARMLSCIEHEHVVRVEDVIRIGGREAVVMEFVDGEDLSDILQACRRAPCEFPIRVALETVGVVARTLADVFEAEGPQGPLRVIHRDVKPSNVRITAEGRVVVLDFGIARAELEDREAVTRSVRYGSRPYMAPERWARAVDTPAADAYGVGCILYECLMGVSFGTAKKTEDEHDLRVERCLIAVRERVGEAGDEVVELLRALLSFRPNDRPELRHVGERLERIARRYEGEDLAAFSARFVPQVTDFVASTVVPVDKRVAPERIPSDGRRASATVDIPTGAQSAANTAVFDDRRATLVRAAMWACVASAALWAAWRILL